MTDNPAAVKPLPVDPQQQLFEDGDGLPTPALVYDLAGIETSVGRIQSDVSAIPDAQLNLALKACHTPEILRAVADLGVGCDVASVAELELAQRCGFSEISGTAPALTDEDLTAYREAGITVDADNLDQLERFGRLFPGSDVGLRIRVPLPDDLTTNATFGQNSRFGMRATDPSIVDTIQRHRLRVTRLHVHTGQTSPQSLLYLVQYLTRVAQFYSDVELIDIGGGFYGLYVNRGTAQLAMRKVADMIEEFAHTTGRRLKTRFEPGAAMLGPYGYLFTTVMAVEAHHDFYDRRVVTVDASAWNLAPWHKPTVLHPTDKQRTNDPALVAGRTLYEGDFFGYDGRGGHRLDVPYVKVGERLAIAAAGAYTMTNYRRFHMIEPPVEYLYHDGRMQRLNSNAELSP